MKESKKKGKERKKKVAGGGMENELRVTRAVAGGEN